LNTFKKEARPCFWKQQNGICVSCCILPLLRAGFTPPFAAAVAGTEGALLFLLLARRFGCNREEASWLVVSFIIVTDFGLRQNYDQQMMRKVPRNQRKVDNKGEIPAAISTCCAQNEQSRI
jgi:hypothetical protein